MDKINLIKPSEAPAEVREIFEDIKKTKGANFLTPTWGFFALDVELLRHWWGLTKRLQMTEGSCSRKLLNYISLVCAGEVDCPRCINNHQVHLMEQFGIDPQTVQQIVQFESSGSLPEEEKSVLRFARKVAFAEPVEETDYVRLREYGYDDRAICEIVSMAMLESSMARHAVGVAPFETGDEWPRENLPSATYAANVNR